MRRRLTTSLLALGLAALPACAVLPGGPAPAPAASPSAAPVAVAVAPAGEPAKPRGVVTGVVRAPKGIIGRVLPTGGGNVLPTGGGNVLPTGGGNVLPTGGGNVLPSGAGGFAPAFGLRALTDEPLAGAQVYLADAAGQPYPSLAPVTADAQGRYTFPDVPAGYTFMVVAAATDTGRKKDVTLQTLVRSSELGATAGVDAATSLVTLAVTEGQGGALGEFNAAAFRTATEATARRLDDGQLPDLGDRSAILAKVNDLAKAVAELRTALDQLKRDLQDIKASLEEIKTAVTTRPPAPPPSGQGGPGGPGAVPACGPGYTFRFQLSGTYDAAAYPLIVTFFTPDGRQLSQLRFERPGDTPTTTFGSGCPLIPVLSDKNAKELARGARVVPGDPTKPIVLPF